MNTSTEHTGRRAGARYRRRGAERDGPARRMHVSRTGVIARPAGHAGTDLEPGDAGG